jgi:hypothetical protein
MRLTNLSIHQNSKLLVSITLPTESSGFLPLMRIGSGRIMHVFLRIPTIVNGHSNLSRTPSERSDAGFTDGGRSVHDRQWETMEVCNIIPAFLGEAGARCLINK